MMQPEGAIAPWPGRDEQDRRDERLACCWQGAAALPDECARPHEWTRSAVDTPLVWLDETTRMPAAGAGEPMLVALGASPPAAAIQALLAAADAGARVYVLASPGTAGSGARASQPDVMDVLAGRAHARVLVRHVRGLPCTAVLTRRGHQAGVFLGPPAAPARWWLRLSPDQGQALFQALVHLFWHQAEDEAWTGAGPLRFQAPGQRPFDVPLPDAGAAARLIAAWPGAPDMSPDACPDVSLDVWHAPDGRLPARGRPNILVVPPSGSGQEALCEAVDAGATVIHADTGLPLLTTDGRAGALHQPGDRWHLRLALAPDQALALAQIVGTAASAAPWELRVRPAVGELAGHIWLPGADAPAVPLDRQELSCGRVTATSLRAMPETLPASKPAPHALARAAVWTWTVDPPRAPAGAREDALVRAWRDLDAQVDDRLARARARLEDIEGQAGLLGRTFTALAGALLGFGRTRDALRRQAGELGSSPPSARGPEGASELLRQLAALEQDIDRLDGNMDEAGRKAHEEQERAQQRSAWAAERTKAEARLPGVREQRERLEQELARVQADEAALPTIEDKADRKARKAKLHNDRHRVEQRIKRLESDENALRRTLAEDFVFRPAAARAAAMPTASRGAPFVPAARPPARTGAAPAEALPAAGALVADRGKRYLIIDRWDDLACGEAEAERLGAMLVAPAEDA